MLECNKNYATLVLNCTLMNSMGTLSVSEIDRKYRNNNILKEIYKLNPLIKSFFGKSSE